MLGIISNLDFSAPDISILLVEPLWGHTTSQNDHIRPSKDCIAFCWPVFLHCSWIFDSGTLIKNCFSWHFMLKTWCSILIHNIRCFYGPCIRPRMQKNLCFEQCLDLDFIAKVAVITWLWAALWLGIKNNFGLFLFSGFFWGNPCENIHAVKRWEIDPDMCK